MMAKNNDNSQQDIELFRKTMVAMGLDPNQQKYSERHIPHKIKAKPAVEISSRQLAEVAPDASILVDQTHGDYAEFARSGLQKRVLQKLKHGDYKISAQLDLHGYTTIQASQMLPQFLLEALNNGHSCVSIIHGKGLHSLEHSGILKHFTADYLKTQAAVKAFCSAQPKDGGTGAVYVLLRVGISAAP